MEMLAQNMSNKAKMEIDYYGTVPLDDVPTTIEGLRNLVAKFRDQVQRVNNGVGVAICAGFRPLSDFNDKYTFLKNKELMDAMDEFNYKFENLRVAKSVLRSFVSDLPEDVPDDYIEKIMDFSERLSNALNVFQEVIANLNMEEGSGQLSPADKAFDDNTKVSGVNKYTKEIKKIISEFVRDTKRFTGIEVSDDLDEKSKNWGFKSRLTKCS
ncbi:hypothetical protein AVEN_118148-1 [Araneus ventricosus]|uniref:Uncharacterized protein n=1 Tax=Araneus ventricosus TaxID=182803 RepID=A0A4Y2P8P1_ARAVE|nr:hypothetical protein AVEN_118148-1 [Araneus ventricosus]